MLSLRETLIARDGITNAEADELIAEARAQRFAYLDDGDTELAHDICEEMFGLEPDYLDDLLYGE